MDKQFTTLRIQRILAGLPQHTLAEKIGRSQPFLSRLETGSGYAKVDADLARKIADTLGVPAEKIFNDTPEGTR